MIKPVEMKACLWKRYKTLPKIRRGQRPTSFTVRRWDERRILPLQAKKICTATLCRAHLYILCILTCSASPAHALECYTFIKTMTANHVQGFSKKMVKSAFQSQEKIYQDLEKILIQSGCHDVDGDILLNQWIEIQEVGTSEHKRQPYSSSMYCQEPRCKGYSLLSWR